MDIKLDITPEKINEYVANSVIESSIGEALKKSIDDQIQKLNRGWDSPLDKVVRSEIESACYRILRDEYKEQIEQSIKDILPKYITNDFIGEIMQNALNNMIGG